jgi:GWxTD domain-containing protein
MAAVLLGPAVPGATARAEVQDSRAAARAEPALDAVLLRTWSDGQVTMVDGLANVPLAILAGGTTGSYRFELTVFGADGLQLYRDSWERSVSTRTAAYAGVASATLLEPFRFGVTDGSYEVELRAYSPDAPDLGTSVKLKLDGFSERPVASDLILADRIEPLNAEAGGSWSITHGAFGISAVARTAVTPVDPDLYYYVELYGDAEADGAVDVAAAVVGPDGKPLFQTPASRVTVPAGGVPYAGNLDLAGLPPGEYDLRLVITSTGSGDLPRTVREAPFRMLDRSSMAESAADAASEEQKYFESLSEDELEDTFGGVGYLVSESERQAYRSLPVDAKRRYLTEFFRRHDPTPGVPGNGFLEDYVERVGTVRMKYGELVGTGERPPWTTDAGRIYLRWGEPDERLINHFPSGADTRPVGGTASLQGEAPYEIWSYHSTGFVYLFIQENQFGVWKMIFTTDPNMRSLADWRARVGAEALRDLSTKFGVQPRF